MNGLTLPEVPTMSGHEVTQVIAEIGRAEQKVAEARACVEEMSRRVEEASRSEDSAQAEVALTKVRVARQEEETARARAKAAKDRLMDLVHSQLREIAVRKMGEEKRDRHTWGPTDLLNETYLKLELNKFFQKGVDRTRPADRGFFFAAVMRAMTQVLIDHARRRKAVKRGPDRRVPLDDYLDYLTKETGKEFEDLVAFLDELESLDHGAWLVATLRLFGDCRTDQGIAEHLGVTAETVERRWLKVRTQLLVGRDR
jgi:RNA polymerase sigma factor (TIGR02999 family)